MDKEALEARMLNGEDFTYGGLSKEFDTKDDNRLIDRTIQRLRKAGKIAILKRTAKGVIWRAVK